MPSPEGLLPVFYASSTIACLGFLSLLVQTGLGIRKDNANVDRLVKLSAVATDGEEKEPTKPNSQPPGPGNANISPEACAAGSKEADMKLIHDQMNFLNSEFQAAARSRDTTPEIVNAICTYLSAAGNLLSLRQGSHGGPTATWKTELGLNHDAGKIVQRTTAETASLGAPVFDLNGPGLVVPLLTGGVSLVAVWTAVAAYTAERRPLVIGGKDDLIVSFSGPCAGEAPDAESMPLRLLLVGMCTSAAVHAFVPCFVGSLTDDRLVRAVFACPVSIATSMAVALSLLGVPWRVLEAGFFSSVGLIAMTMIAASASSMSSEHEDDARRTEKEVVDKQHTDKEG